MQTILKKLDKVIFKITWKKKYREKVQEKTRMKVATLPYQAVNWMMRLPQSEDPGAASRAANQNDETEHNRECGKMTEVTF